MITAEMVKTLRERTGAAMMACKKALEETKGNMDAAIEVLRKAGEAKAAKRADKVAAEGRIVISADKQTGFMLELNSETDFVARDENFVAFAKHVAMRGLVGKASTVVDLMALSHDAAGGDSIDAVRCGLINKLGENVQVRRVAFLDASGCVGAYCHGDRIGVLVALDKDLPDLAKDIAMHIAALNPNAIGPNDVAPELIERERVVFEAQAKESGKPAEIVAKMVAGRVAKFLAEITLMGQPFVKDANVTVGDLLKQQGAQVLAFIRFEVGEGIEKVSQNFADEVMAQVQGTR